MPRIACDDSSTHGKFIKQMEKEIESVGHDFETAAVFKEYCSRKDSFYIYKMKDKKEKPDLPSFIFKTSTKKTQVSPNMKEKYFISRPKNFVLLRQREKMQRFRHINGKRVPPTALLVAFFSFLRISSLVPYSLADLH